MPPERYVEPTAQQLIARLGLARHPEGGWYREVFRSAQRVHGAGGERSALTTIYYLLEAGETSRWHVVASDETWHFHLGAELALHVYAPQERRLVTHRLGMGIGTARAAVEAEVNAAGGALEDLSAVAAVPAGSWQAARSTGDWSLVSCCVGPGFEFADFRFVASLDGYPAHFDGALGELRSLL